MGEGFSDPVAAGGGALIYNSVHSENYQTGVSGWTINQDGTAEFVGVTVVGGSLLLSGANNSYMKLYVDAGTPRIEFRPVDVPLEVSVPGFIEAGLFGTSNQQIEINSGYDSTSTTDNVSRIILTGSSLSGFDYSQMFLESDYIRLECGGFGTGNSLELSTTSTLFATDPGIVELFSETDQTRTGSTAFTDGSPVLDSTFSAPSSGTIYIVVGGALEATGAAGASLGFELREGSSSGTVVLAADQSRAIRKQGTDYGQMSFLYPVSGLTGNATYYIKLRHNVDDAAQTATIFRRYGAVLPHGAY